MEETTESASRVPTDLQGVPAPVRAAYTAPATAWDAESAAEAGRKSGEVRRRRAAMTPEERVRDSISKESDALIKELIDAALGKGDFASRWVADDDGESKVFVPGLKPETRVTAITRLLEWQLGRPAAVKPKEDADTSAAPAAGDELFE